MAWIESHQEIGQHPKTKRLARILGISVPTAIGHLHLLWHWCLDFAQDGDLSPLEPWEIADPAKWDGDPDLFATALKDAGFVDPDGKLHDWYEYAGKLIERRKADAARKRSGRHPAEMTGTSAAIPDNVRDASNGVPLDVHGSSSGTPADLRKMSDVTVPNPTLPNPTGDDSPPSGPPQPEQTESRTKRGSRIAEGFAPSADMVQWAKDEFGYDKARIEAETAKFRDHFGANGKTMKDWVAAWRGWIRRSPDFYPTGRPEPTLPASAAAIRQEEQRQERQLQPQPATRASPPMPEDIRAAYLISINPQQYSVSERAESRRVVDEWKRQHNTVDDDWATAQDVPDMAGVKR